MEATTSPRSTSAVSALRWTKWGSQAASMIKSTQAHRGQADSFAPSGWS